MADEPTVQVGEVVTRVTDPHAISPVSCDILVEHRVIDGTLFLTLGSHIFDGAGPPEVRVVARLRMNLSVAENIYQTTQRTLENIRLAAEEAKKTAN
jgi:hypothetical protein